MRWGKGMLAAALVVAACETASSGDDASTIDAASVTSSCASAAECDDGIACNGAEQCTSGRCVRGELMRCDDGDGCTTDRCDVATDACVHAPVDADGDGAAATACGGTDCDDGDPLRGPTVTEVCDAEGHDEDCDPTTTGSRDQDGDGFVDATCCNGTTCGDDCNDVLAGAHPGQAEACDGVDNDCDTAVDEGVLGTFTLDADGDGFGSDAGGAATMQACRRPEGYAIAATDCDDTNRRVNPALPEVCDPAGLDENCDGDANPASLCACTGTDSRSCPLSGECAAGTERCISGSWSECTISAQLETCDMRDEDCDGTIDEGLRVHCFVDADNDSYAATGAAALDACPAPGRTSVGGCPGGTTDRAPSTLEDCDDHVGSTRPGAVERLDGIDQDCDGAIDEGAS